jgi:hypothetical protein
LFTLRSGSVLVASPRESVLILRPGAIRRSFPAAEGDRRLPDRPGTESPTVNPAAAIAGQTDSGADIDGRADSPA